MNKLLILLTALLLAGCYSKPAPIKPAVSPKMATASVDGKTAITWKAESNQTYTVYYTDAPLGVKPDWKRLPQADRLRGTGKHITIEDTVQKDLARRYILLSGDQTP